MIFDKVKSILNKSPIKDKIQILDDSDIIKAPFFQIEMNNDIKGHVVFRLFDKNFDGEVFFNDVDSCYIELNENQYQQINLKSIFYNGIGIDLNILEFFHIKSINVIPITNIY